MAVTIKRLGLSMSVDEGRRQAGFAREKLSQGKEPPCIATNPDTLICTIL
jgi:hypothetical protein